MGEFHERQGVDSDLLALMLHRQAVERPAGAETGTVAQTGDWCAADAVYQLRACRPVAKVERHYLHGDRVLCAKLIGELAEAFAAACGEQ